jgi:hypothetical protein
MLETGKMYEATSFLFIATCNFIYVAFYFRKIVVSRKSCSTAELPALCAVVMGEVVELPNSSHSTTLIILPALSCFDKYLEVLAIIESLVQSEGYQDYVQVASFHPEYQFEGSSPIYCSMHYEVCTSFEINLHHYLGSDIDDVENWTNRSPYPMLHLLRTSEVGRAVEQCNGKTDEIWRRNEATMRRLGCAAIKEERAAILKDEADGFPCRSL